MKLDRLPSTTHTLSRETAERARQAAAEAPRWVAPADGADADRERSLRQELEAAKARHPEATQEILPPEAREMAEQLLNLGKDAGLLLKSQVPNLLTPSVDTEA